NSAEWRCVQLGGNRIATGGGHIGLAARGFTHSRARARISGTRRRTRRRMVRHGTARYGPAYRRWSRAFVLRRAGNKTRGGTQGPVADPARPRGRTDGGAWKPDVQSDAGKARAVSIVHVDVRPRCVVRRYRKNERRPASAAADSHI